MSKRKVSNIDFSQAIFFAEQLKQRGYDREIDEGMSSGMRRYVTLDVSSLSEDQVTGVLEGLIAEAYDFNLCKLVQVAGFNKEGRRYLTVGGECHDMWQGSTKNMMLDRVRSVTGELLVEYLEAHITPPVQGKSYHPTNFGLYGSTGSPALGIPQHPDAANLREQGKIR